MRVRGTAYEPRQVYHAPEALSCRCWDWPGCKGGSAAITAIRQRKLVALGYAHLYRRPAA